MSRKVLIDVLRLGAVLGLPAFLASAAHAMPQVGARAEMATRMESASSPPPSGAIQIQQVQGRVYMVSGAGANVTVQVGDEAVVVVDPGRSEDSPDVLRLIRQLSNRPIEFVINTTIDSDHLGANESVAKAGHYDSGQPGEKPGAAIMGHLNLLNRLTEAKAPSAEVPTDTYESASWSLFNDEAIVLYHPAAAHTDADSYVFFRRSDVISTGDLFQPSIYPVIESDKGGTIDGVIDGLNDVIALMVPRENEEGGTYLIPGHGRVCDRTDIVNYRDAMTIIRARIQDMVSKGMTLDQVKAAKPTFDYDGIYGSDSGPWTTSMFIEVVYNNLHDQSKEKPKEGEKPKQKTKTSGVSGGKG
jgi:cyclase